MADKNFMQKLYELPKWVLAAGGVLLITLLAYGMYLLVFGADKESEPVDAGSVIINMPDASGDEFDKTRADMYREGDYAGRRRGASIDDYWNSLGGGDLVSSGDVEEEEDFSYLDNGEYTEAEKRMIRSGIKTRAEIDRNHEEMAAFRESLHSSSGGSSSSGSNRYVPMTRAQKDSQYNARMEQAIEMAARLQAMNNPQASVSEKTEEEDYQHIDVEEEPVVIPLESFSDEEIISSLDGPSNSVGTGTSAVRRPVKATFLKDEKVSSGARVVIRLMQDLTLSDGTQIPVNTHLMGICTIGRRLRIQVTSLHYGGRMYSTNLSIFDNDGTEGIYCPLVEEGKRKSSAAKKIAGEVVTSVGTVASSMLSGNPMVGRMAGSSLSGVTSTINSDGSTTVNVTAGYEFYVYENIKEESGRGKK